MDKVANRLQISHGSVYEIIHNRLGFHKFVQDGSQNNSQCCTNKRVGHLQQHLDRYDKEGVAFLDRIITGDEIWPTITSRSVNGGVWNGNIQNRLSGKSSKANRQQENCCLQFFGIHKAQYWTGFQQKTMLITVRCLLTS